MLNPLNEHMLGAMLQASQKATEKHINDIHRALTEMTEGATTRHVTLNAEVLYAVLKERMILAEVFSGGVNIVKTFIHDATADKEVPQGILNSIEDYAKVAEYSTPHTDKLTEELLPTLEENIFNG